MWTWAELQAMKEEADRLGVRNSIRLPGRVADRDLGVFYTLCDVFALPTGSDAGGHSGGAAQQAAGMALFSHSRGLARCTAAWPVGTPRRTR